MFEHRKNRNRMILFVDKEKKENCRSIWLWSCILNIYFLAMYLNPLKKTLTTSVNLLTFVVTISGIACPQHITAPQCHLNFCVILREIKKIDWLHDLVLKHLWAILPSSWSRSPDGKTPEVNGAFSAEFSDILERFHDLFNYRYEKGVLILLL